MASGISISIGANTRDFVSGVQQGSDALEKLQQLLQRIGEGGGNVSDDDLTAIMRQAQEATAAVEKLKATSDTVRSSGSGPAMVFDEMGSKAKESGERVEEGSKVGEAALMNLGFSAMTAGEAFKGPSGLLNSVGSFAAFMGPALGPELALPITVLGVAMAAVGQTMGDDTEAAKELQAAVSNLVSSWVGSGDGISALDANLRDWTKNSADYGGSLGNLRKELGLTDQSYRDVADAIASGSVPAMQRAVTSIQREIDARKALSQAAESESHTAYNSRAAVDDETGARNRNYSAALKQIDAQDASTAALKKAKAEIQDNITKEQQARVEEAALAAAMGETVKQYKAQEAASAQAKSANEDFKNSVRDTAKASADSANGIIANSKLSAKAYIQNQDAQVKAIQNFESNASKVYQTVDANTRDYLKSQGTSMSQEYATYLAATPAQQAQLRKDWAIEAQISGDTKDVDAKTAAEGKKTVDGPTVRAKGDTKDVDSKVQRMGRESQAGPTSKIRGNTDDVDRKVAKKKAERDDGPTVKLRADDDAVQRRIADLRGKTYSGPTVRIGADLSAFNAAVQRARGTSITVTATINGKRNF
ncbi:hypothetical protein DEI93_07175 [Curtobacterium sp. MCBD17_035]|uniref:hypothetical protein n=1 Tax=Curtobacterium sp. MCBD17_035 TaxID=2175673 RepID=UPI000DA6EB3F|nr:hypothetical protein [Curtobacterium sp. MCBD17_035]WIB68803.1 hypothetical protein DEI93_07175 [Curtobacterium sp. MCBD17_035]